MVIDTKQLDSLIEEFTESSDTYDIGMNMLAAGLGDMHRFYALVDDGDLTGEVGHALLDTAADRLATAREMIQDKRLGRFVREHLVLIDKLRGHLPGHEAGSMMDQAGPGPDGKAPDLDLEQIRAAVRTAGDPAGVSDAPAPAVGAGAAGRQEMDIGYWRQREADASRLRETLLAAESVDLKARLTTELELGLVRRLLGADPDPVADHLAMAMNTGAALALARVCARRGSGFAVELRWPAEEGGQDYIRLPAVDNGFGWPDWLDTFALALLCDDSQALAVLGTADCVDACALSFQQVDRFWPLLCGAFAALWQRDPAAAGLLDDAAGLLEQVSVMDPAMARALIAPLVPLGKAVSDGDAAAVARHAEEAFSAWSAWFAAQPDGNRDPDGLFALPLSALLAEARRRELAPLPDSGHRLAPFTRTGPTPELVAVYPRLGILDAVEAEWLMQNEAFARHDRSSVLRASDGPLVARYRAFDAPGIPNAELELELLGNQRDRIFDGSHAPPALDVGELLHRAQVLASKPHPDPDVEELYDLDQAVEAMDLALAYVDAMPSGFDPATLHSTVGEEMWREEPGRFRPERMLVYRDALAKQAGREERASTPAPETGSSETRELISFIRGVPKETSSLLPRVGAARASQEEVIKLAKSLAPLAMPVLYAIAMDKDGSAIRELVPRDGDYDLAFTGEAVAAAREHYASEWPRQLAEWAGPSVDPDWEIDAHLSPAGLLGSDNGLSRPFPGGYRKIAQWLTPHRVWVCWRYRPRDADAGIGMNGLVWLDDHWAWFPKPYRFVKLLRRH